VCQTDIPSGALPTGAGNWCYDTPNNCLNGTNACNVGTPCSLDVSICATGQAVGQQHNYFCELDMPAGALPNGGGQLCYDTALQCNNGPNSCGLSNPCTLDPAACSTGWASSPGAGSWLCSSSSPPDAVPNGAGALCYTSNASCVSGPNLCTACEVDYTTCASGAAGGALGDAPPVWFCPLVVPLGGVPNAAGEYCYDTITNCFNGINGCSPDGLSCHLDYTTCATGAAAAATNNNFFCPSDGMCWGMPVAMRVVSFACCLR
jgi:hypothetical protein